MSDSAVRFRQAGNRRAGRDPVERAIELALRPGFFVSYHAGFSFVRELDTVKTQIAAVGRQDPSRAIELVETFLAGCHEKANEIDDSSGTFGQFVEDLFCLWIKARQAARAGPDDTIAKLLRWMDDDPWGFCHDLEKHAVKVLNRAGLAAFESQIRKRFAAAAAARSGAPPSSLSSADYERRRWAGALRAVYEAQRDVRRYIEFAEDAGLTAADCHVVARLLVSRRQPSEALAWVERGLEIERTAPHESMTGYELRRLKRKVLSTLGRQEEALLAAWADYRQHPSTFSYQDLMAYVPKGQHSVWHAKAIEAAAQGELDSLIELLVATREVARLADVIRQRDESTLVDLSHDVTEPAAIRLTKHHPDAAARLRCAQGLRIMNAKKSRYYDVAIEHFEQARRCYERAGLVSQWEQIASQVCASHHRKLGFMSAFERVVAGSGPRHEPTFLERAKAKWRQRRQADES